MEIPHNNFRKCQGERFVHHTYYIAFFFPQLWTELVNYINLFTLLNNSCSHALIPRFTNIPWWSTKNIFQWGVSEHHFLLLMRSWEYNFGHGNHDSWTLIPWRDHLLSLLPISCPAIYLSLLLQCLLLLIVLSTSPNGLYL